MHPTDGEDPDLGWFFALCTASGLSQGAHHGRVDFRAGSKIVANVEDDGAVTLKLPIEEQHALLQAHPAEVRLPLGWAKHGWTTIRLDLVDRAHASELLALAIDNVVGSRKQ